MKIEEWSIRGADGQAILGNTHIPDRGPIGHLLIAHGFKGYKDYGFLPHLAQAAAMRGFFAHRFNFSHSGMTNRLDTFERPDLFERDTWRKQIKDMIEVDVIRPTAFPVAHRRSASDAFTDVSNFFAGPVIWFGHSRGGDVCLLSAANAFEPAFYSHLGMSSRADRGKPAALIIAASPHVSSYLTDEQRDQLRRAGYLETASTRTKQTLRIGRAWLEELEAHPDQFDPLLAASFIKCPALFIHGDADQTVDVESSRLLAEAAKPHSQLEIIPGGNHTFNCPNPYSLDREPPELTRRFIDLVCDFAVEQATRAR